MTKHTLKFLLKGESISFYHNSIYIIEIHEVLTSKFNLKAKKNIQSMVNILIQ